MFFFNLSDLKYFIATHRHSSPFITMEPVWTYGSPFITMNHLDPLQVPRIPAPFPAQFRTSGVATRVRGKEPRPDLWRNWPTDFGVTTAATSGSGWGVPKIWRLNHPKYGLTMENVDLSSNMAISRPSMVRDFIWKFMGYNWYNMI